jgi:hypothetical protein
MKKATRGLVPLTTTFGVAFILVVSSLMIVVTASGPTVVKINPASQTVSAGESVVVTVDCAPGRPVKGFELKLSFDPSMLQASSVSEGDFFGGYTTFFNPGTINNQAGTIINVYDLIVGPGNVTTNGTLVTITFTAGSVSGTSALTLYGVQLTNETEYISVSVSSGSVTVVGGSAPPEGPPPSGPPSSPPSENQPPVPPLKPVGPTLIEVGTEYVYNSSAFDPEGGRVRLRFDWGDGSLSNWSGLVSSNTSVSFSYAWQNVSTHAVRAMAQDENAANSSWSEPLIVIVSQVPFDNNSPTVTFVVPSNVTSNHTMLFNASGCTDPDGVIISYLWDFGDGSQGTGETPTHVYHSPGYYTVTLTVTDSSGLTSSISQLVIVTEQALGPTTGAVASPPYLTILILVCIIGAVLGFVVVFREPLRTMLFHRTPHPRKRIILSSGTGSANIEQILDSLFLTIEDNALPLNKDTLLDAYCDLIIENVETNANVHVPDLSITEVEKIVDELFHSKVGEQIDKM